MGIGELSNKQSCPWDSAYACSQDAQAQLPCKKAEEPDEGESRLQQRETALNRWAQELAEEKERLSERERLLIARSDAAQRYALERAEWEKLASRSGEQAGETELAQTLRQTGDDFRAVKKLMSGLQTQLQELARISGQQNGGAVRELCWLYRELMGNGDAHSQRAAARLAAILRQELGAEPIDPEPGSVYNSELHERLGGCGDRIRFCSHVGWRWDGELIRAVVVTE